MKRMSRLILIGAITLLVLSSACNVPALPASVPSATLPVAGQATSTPLSIDIVNTDTPAPVIPITGMDVVSLQCQFCVNEEVHAVLIMSNQAFFHVADPDTGVTCLSAKEMDGRRILLCRGAQNASFTLNVCVDTTNCLEFPIKLQRCPLVPGAGTGTPTVPSTFVPLTPVILTPRNTLIPSTGVPPTGVPPTNAPSTVTPSTPVPTNTNASTPLPTSSTEPPPEPTSTPEPPTVEPATVEPTEPIATSSQTGGGGGGGEEEQLVICHVSPGNPDQRRTITVSQSSWEEEHSQHGDSRGAC